MRIQTLLGGCRVGRAIIVPKSDISSEATVLGNNVLSFKMAVEQIWSLECLLATRLSTSVKGFSAVVRLVASIDEELVSESRGYKLTER
jgi:hypothetical protein